MPIKSNWLYLQSLSPPWLVILSSLNLHCHPDICHPDHFKAANHVWMVTRFLWREFSSEQNKFFLFSSGTSFSRQLVRSGPDQKAHSWSAKQNGSSVCYEVGHTREPIHKVLRRRRGGPAQGTPENLCHHFGNLFSLAQNIQSFLAGSPPTRWSLFLIFRFLSQITERKGTAMY